MALPEFLIKWLNLYTMYNDKNIPPVPSKIDENQKELIDIILNAGRISLWRYDVKERKFYRILGSILMPDGTTYEDCAEALTKNSKIEYHRIFNNLISGKSTEEKTIFHFYIPQTKEDLYYRSELTVRLDENGAVESVLGTQVDVSDDVIQKRKLEELRIKTDLINEKNLIVQWNFDIENQSIISYNNGAINPGCNIKIEDYIRMLHPEDQSSFRIMIDKMIKREAGNFDLQARCYMPGYADYRYVFISVVAIISEDGVVSYTGIRRDITTEALREKELADKRYKTELIEKASGLILWEYDTNRGVFISEDTEVYGKELTFQDYVDFTHPLYKDVASKIWNILENGLNQSFSSEWKYSYFGDWKYAVIAGEPYEIDASGRVTKYIGYRRDTTDIALMNESLRNSKLKTDMAMKNANMVMWEYDVNDKMFTAFNDPFTNYDESVQCSREEYLAIMHPDSVKEVEKIFALMDKQEIKDFSFNIKLKLPNLDDWQYAGVHGSCLEVSEYDLSKATKYVGFRIDNTELVNLTQSYAESRDLISNILGQSPSIIFIKDISDDFRYIMVNDMFSQLLGMTEEQTIGKTDSEIFPKEVADRMRNDDIITISQNTYSFIEELYIDGKLRSLHTTKRAITTNGRKLLVCISSEITEAVEQKLALENANKKTELVLNNANAGFVYINNDFRVLWENIDSVKDNIPYIEKYKRGSICYENVHGLNKPCEGCVLERANKSLKSEKNTNVFYGDKVFEVNATPVIDINGKVNGCVCRIDNITEAYQHKSALEKVQKYLDLAIIAGDVAVWGYDPKTNTVSNISGRVFVDDVVTVDEANSLIHPDDIDEFADIWQRVYSGESEKEYLCMRFKNPFTGKFEYVDKNIIAMRTDSGELSMIIGTHHDVTESKLRKMELLESKNKAEEANALLQSVIKQIPLGLYIKDIGNDLRYVIMNDVLASIDGISASDAIGKTDYEIFDKEIADMFVKESLLAISKPDGVLTTTQCTIDWHGEVSIYENCDTVITVANGKRLLVGVIYDITEKENMINELKETKELAVQSDKLKSAFLANMSHEIRTPLNAIVGFSELLADAETIEEKEDYSNIISVNNELLLRLIGDILDLSKIESGMIDLKPSVFNVTDVCNEIFLMIKQRGVKPSLKLTIKNSYDSCVVSLDKNRFKQVVINFMTNAVKYTDNGEIIMGYDYINDGVKVYVKDTGIGIAEENHSKIFDRFEKFDTFAQGTGLGLSICKAIVEAQGGKIDYEANHDVGSTFWAWFPCEAQIGIAELNGNNLLNDNQLKEMKFDSSKFKILIAEDNDSNFLLLKHILKGFDIVRVVNGADALESVRNNSDFDIVLMDWKMPIMDGLESTKKIREFNKTIPIIAVTANSYDSDIIQVMGAGCNDFIAKPLKRQQLLDVIDKYRMM